MPSLAGSIQPIGPEPKLYPLLPEFLADMTGAGFPGVAIRPIKGGRVRAEYCAAVQAVQTAQGRPVASQLPFPQKRGALRGGGATITPLAHWFKNFVKFVNKFDRHGETAKQIVARPPQQINLGMMVSAVLQGAISTTWICSRKEPSRERA